MEYRKLGKSDVMVSPICMGCMGFGDASKGMHSWTLSEEESRKIIKYGLDAGINFYDTAAAYQGGTSEEFVGRAMRDFVKREEVVLATKFLPRTKEEIANGVSGREYIHKSLDASLKRMQTEYIDLYIYHMWDYETPIEEIMEGLHELIKAGKARAIGISNCYAWQVAKANGIAKMNGWEEFVSVQGHYNLIFREEEREMAPYCKEENLAMTPYSALAAGRLAKHPGEKSKRLTEDQFAKGKYDATEEQDQKIIQRVAEIAKKRGISMTEVSLSWLLTKVTAPIVGATKPHHVDGAVAAVNVKLTDEEIRYLEELYVPHRIVGVMAQTNK